MSKFHAKAGDEEATLTSVMALRSGIENGALCKMAADGDGYGIYKYLKMAGAPDINTRSFGELNPLAEAAKKNHQGIVGMLLPHANEETKIDALVELTMVAPGAYPIDPFVATGRMLYKTLETPDSSFEIVRNRTEADPMESSMVPGFLDDISQS
jgi:hypothetical protein